MAAGIIMFDDIFKELSMVVAPGTDQGKRNYYTIRENFDLILLVITLVFGAATSYVGNHVPPLPVTVGSSTTIVEAHEDWGRFIENTLLLGVISFVAIEMIRIKAGMGKMEAELNENKKRLDKYRFNVDLYDGFIRTIIQSLSHPDPIVRDIVPLSMRSFFKTISLQSEYIDLKSDYFGLQVYIRFLRLIKDLQIDEPETKLIIRASHSASLAVWEEGKSSQVELLLIQQEFRDAGGELYRIVVKNPDSRDTIEAYASVVESMARAGANVYFLDLTDAKADFHDYLLCHLDDRFYAMKWSWERRDGSIAFGTISGCELYIDREEYRNTCNTWNSLVGKLINDVPWTGLPDILKKRPTALETEKMRAILPRI